MLQTITVLREVLCDWAQANNWKVDTIGLRTYADLREPILSDLLGYCSFKFLPAEDQLSVHFSVKTPEFSIPERHFLEKYCKEVACARQVELSIGEKNNSLELWWWPNWEKHFATLVENDIQKELNAQVNFGRWILVRTLADLRFYNLLKGEEAVTHASALVEFSDFCPVN